MSIPDPALKLRILPSNVAITPFLFPLVIVFLLVFGPIIAPFSATDFSPANALQPPGFPYLLGTDEFGRDILSRILVGVTPTLLPAFISTLGGIMLGIITGLVSGYLGGIYDEIIMRVMDVLLSIPALILAMLVIVMMGANMITLILAIAFVFWPRSARLLRSVALELAKNEYVEAARARGETALYVTMREILPNMWGIIVVDFALRSSNAILLVASLSYLGIGVSPPTPAWGLLVKEGQPLLQIAPWIVIFPCITIGIVAVGSVMFGEFMRKMLSIRDKQVFK